eukprot:353445-Chlamydomonas_euryale.AAC.14
MGQYVSLCFGSLHTCELALAFRLAVLLFHMMYAVGDLADAGGNAAALLQSRFFIAQKPSTSFTRS